MDEGPGLGAQSCAGGATPSAPAGSGEGDVRTVNPGVGGAERDTPLPPHPPDPPLSGDPHADPWPRRLGPPQALGGPEQSPGGLWPLLPPAELVLGGWFLGQGGDSLWWSQRTAIPGWRLSPLGCAMGASPCPGQWAQGHPQRAAAGWSPPHAGAACWRRPCEGKTSQRVSFLETWNQPLYDIFQGRGKGP